MKSILPFAVAITVSLVTFIHAADPASDPELLGARTRYQTALANGTKALRDRYVLELQQLKTRAMSMHKVDVAEAIQQEIESMLDEEDVQGAGVNKAKLVNTTWIWNGGETITLLSNGKARWSNNGAESFTWRIVDHAQRIIKGVMPGGRKYKIILDPDLKTGIVYEDTQPKRPTSRVDAK